MLSLKQSNVLPPLPHPEAERLERLLALDAEPPDPFPADPFPSPIPHLGEVTLCCTVLIRDTPPLALVHQLAEWKGCPRFTSA